MEPAIDDALVEEALQRAQQQQQQQQPPQPQQQAQQQQPQQQRPPPAPTVDDPDYLALLEQGRRRDWTEFVALDMLYKSGHDPLGRPVVVMVASRLPAKKVNLDELLQFFVQVMDPIVRDDYVLVYVGSEITKANMPPFSWLRRAYGLFSRKYKKHIQKLYIIHPTAFTRLILKLTKPLVSEKFHRKLFMVDNVAEMSKFISPDQLRLPEQCYNTPLRKGQQFHLFGLTLDQAAALPQCRHSSGVPKPIYDVMKHLYTYGLDTEGLFRVSGSEVLVRSMRTSMEDGLEVSFEGVDMHAVCGLLKMYVRELRVPCFSAASFARLAAPMKMAGDVWIMAAAEHLSTLSEAQQCFVRLLFLLLSCVEQRAAVNKMTATNLAISLGPHILATGQGGSALQDASMQSAITKRLIESWPRIVQANPALLVQQPFK